MGALHFSNQSIPWKDLGSTQLSSLNPYEQYTWGFCQSYFKGDHKFRVQTSGSTGEPKTITLYRRQLHASAKATIKALSLQSNDTALVCISTEHIAGKMMLVRGLEADMDLFIRQPAALPDLSGLPRIDFVALVPLQVQALLAFKWGMDLIAGSKAVIIGGGELDADSAHSLAKLENPIFQTFGMTETVSHIALKGMGKNNRQAYYHVMEGVEISQDQRGCLVVKGQVTDGKSVITNDLVEIIDPRKFKWLGRWDQVINSGGHKVYPPKLEPAVQKALINQDLSCNFVIMGLSNPKWGQQVVLVLESAQINPEIKNKILRQLEEYLHPYEVPKSILSINKFPLTSTGKWDMPGIRQQLESNS